jgi:hypothetical protein
MTILSPSAWMVYGWLKTVVKGTPADWLPQSPSLIGEVLGRAALLRWRQIGARHVGSPLNRNRQIGEGPLRVQKQTLAFKRNRPPTEAASIALDHISSFSQ